MGECGAPKTSRVTTILWDNDGVLVDTEGLYYRATQEVLAEFGVSLTPAQYKEYCLNDNRGAWHLARARGFTRSDIEAARERRNLRYAQLLREKPLLIKGVRDTLQALRGRFRMGVATSSTRWHFDVIHESTGLMDYFDFAITADDVRETKPHPELYLKALERSGAQPHDSVVIEDSPRGLRAAVAAGIPCFVIPSEWTDDGDFSAASRVLKSVRDLPGALGQRAMNEV